jgi:hypothetical protein
VKNLGGKVQKCERPWTLKRFQAVSRQATFETSPKFMASKRVKAFGGLKTGGRENVSLLIAVRDHVIPTL